MVQCKVAAIGEAMLEFGCVDSCLSAKTCLNPGLNTDADKGAQDASHYQLAFAGDTFNTLFYYQKYAASFLNQPSQPYYVTALGEDAFSKQMIAQWQRDGIRTDYVVPIAGKLPGLYLISLDQDGEREFIYYRSQSAARDLCATPAWKDISKKLRQFQYIYLSGITLAIYHDENRQRLFDALFEARQHGASIVLDTNYRPALWDHAEQAKATVEMFYPIVDIALPTYSDEHLLFGDRTPEETLERLQAAGIQDMVVKQGASGCIYLDKGQVVYAPAQQGVAVVDTTAAGDAFNGCYLAQRAAGVAMAIAVERAQCLAAAVIQQKGALIDSGLPCFR